MTTITIWSDFACPDCYKGEDLLLKAISDLGLTESTIVTFRAAELRPSPSDTFDAHRLMKLAEATSNRKTIIELNRALMVARFEKGLSLANHQVLTEIATTCGLNAEDVKETLADRSKYANEVRLDEEEARRAGVKGIPYMVFNNAFALPEAVDIEDMKAALKRAQTLSGEAHKPGWNNRPHAVTPQEEPNRPGWEAQRPGTCGPNGCKL